MRRLGRPHAALGLAASVLVSACAGTVRGAGSSAPVAQLAPGNPLEGAQWGVLAIDVATGDTLLSRDPARRFIPASTMKIATTVAALDVLGPDHRWSTAVWSSAAVDTTTGTLRGDLILPGSGDPTLSPRFWPDGTDPLERLAEGIAAAGVRRVTGQLVIDASRWDSTTVRASWMVDDLPFDYSATGGAFALAEGETRVEIRGGAAPGDPVTIRWWPVGDDRFVRSVLITGSSDRSSVRAAYLPETRALELTGFVPAGSVDTVAVATRDPVRQAAAAFFRALRARGIAIDGGWRIQWDAGEDFGAGCVSASVPPCPFGRLLVDLPSPPLVDVVPGVLGPSQNWIAEQIVRTLGDPGTGRSAWPEGTAAAARDLETVVGIDPRDVRIVDGSGLSVQDLLTPRALVRILQHARERPWADAFRAALPEPGEAGTTLSDRLLDLRGRLWAKTGSLTNVGTFAGYLTDARGRDVAFAVMVNGANLPASQVRSGIDAVVRALAARR